MNTRCFGMIAREISFRAGQQAVFKRLPVPRASSSAADSKGPKKSDTSKPSFEASSKAKAEKKSSSSEGPPAPPPPAPEDTGMSIPDLKAALLDSFFGTDRGLSASSEVRAEINELISQLESKNPTPSPTEDGALLTGNWKLVYTSSPAVLGLLNFNRLPVVELGDITQKIDMGLLTLENKVSLSGPMARSALITTANLDVRSPKRLQLKLAKGTLQRPEIVESDLGTLPSNITVMGTKLDLTQFDSVINPIKDNLRQAAQQVSSVVANQPDLTVPVDNEQATTWMLITFLDDSMRVVRMDGGALYVFCREPEKVQSGVPTAAALPEVTVEES